VCNLVAITVLTWPSRPLRNSSMRARPQRCWGARPIESGRRLLGGVGRSFLLDDELRGNFSVLADNLLSNVSRIRHAVFVLIEAPWPNFAFPWALILWVLRQVFLQSGSNLESVLRNLHLA